MKKTFLALSLVLASLLVFVNTGCVGDGFDPDHPYANVKWQEIKSIDELKGKWVSDFNTIIFPKTLKGKDYIHIIEKPTDDSYKWNNYIAKYNLTVDQAWAKRYAAIAEVYGVAYPLSDANGTEKGIKVKLKGKTTNKTGIFESTLETLIPEVIADKNLSYFTLSPDKKHLRISGTFRYYSNKFTNSFIGERIYTLED